MYLQEIKNLFEDPRQTRYNKLLIYNSKYKSENCKNSYKNIHKDCVSLLRGQATRGDSPRLYYLLIPGDLVTKGDVALCYPSIILTIFENTLIYTKGKHKLALYI